MDFSSSWLFFRSAHLVLGFSFSVVRPTSSASVPSPAFVLSFLPSFPLTGIWRSGLWRLFFSALDCGFLLVLSQGACPSLSFFFFFSFGLETHPRCCLHCFFPPSGTPLYLSWALWSTHRPFSPWETGPAAFFLFGAPLGLHLEVFQLCCLQLQLRGVGPFLLAGQGGGRWGNNLQVLRHGPF